MRATLLVALYRAGPYLAAKLASLRQLVDFAAYQIILLNCQNLDDERTVYQSFLDFPNILEIYHSSYMTLYQSWDVGLKASESVYVASSNVDDLTHPEYANKCAAYLDDHPEVGVVSSQVLVTDVPNQVWPNWQWVSRLPPLPYPHSTAGPAPLWRRDLHGYGYFGDYRTIGDARMWERWLARGVRFEVYPEDLVLYYLNPLSLERRIDSESGRSLRELDLEADR